MQPQNHKFNRGYMELHDLLQKLFLWLRELLKLNSHKVFSEEKKNVGQAGRYNLYEELTYHLLSFVIGPLSFALNFISVWGLGPEFNLEG